MNSQLVNIVCDADFAGLSKGQQVVIDNAVYTFWKREAEGSTFCKVFKGDLVVMTVRGYNKNPDGSINSYDYLISNMGATISGKISGITKKIVDIISQSVYAVFGGVKTEAAA